jgi:predicted Holliday junction resolvase-like endonuclease
VYVTSHGTVYATIYVTLSVIMYVTVYAIIYLTLCIAVYVTVYAVVYINVREYRRSTSNQKSTIQRNWQHRVHKRGKTKTKTQHNMWWTSLCANKIGT